MKQWLVVVLLLLSISVYSQEAENTNADGIGTFIGGEDPFPWGPETDLPEDLGGLWEVGQTIDGAYILIAQDPNDSSSRPRINVYLFDPCTFDLTATGKAYIRKNSLHTTLVYPQKDLRVKLKLQAYQNKSNKVQMVLMVMDDGIKRKVNKYFPIEPISISSVVTKCEVPNP